MKTYDLADDKRNLEMFNEESALAQSFKTDALEDNIYIVRDSYTLDEGDGTFFKTAAAAKQQFCDIVENELLFVASGEKAEVDAVYLYTMKVSRGERDNLKEGVINSYDPSAVSLVEVYAGDTPVTGTSPMDAFFESDGYTAESGPEVELTSEVKPPSISQ